MPVRELLSRMDSAELSEWLAYDQIDPLPDPYWCAALIASTIARCMGAKSAKLEKFLPRRTKGKPRGVVANGPALLASVRRAVERAEGSKKKGNR